MPHNFLLQKLNVFHFHKFQKNIILFHLFGGEYCSQYSFSDPWLNCFCAKTLDNYFKQKGERMTSHFIPEYNSKSSKIIW